MGSTYTWQNALTVIGPYIKGIPTSTLDITVCDQLNSQLWRAYPWRWAQATLTSNSGVLSLVNGVQDYGIGTTTAGGFYQLLRVRITRTDVSPVITREKDIVQWLAPNLETLGSIDSIQAMALEPVNTQIRLDRAASVGSGTAYQIDGEYWFQPTKVTSTSSVIPFPDAYFDVIIEGLKWKYYKLGDDKRAGEVLVDARTGRRSYTGQLGSFMDQLMAMREQEDYGDGPPQRFPESSFGFTRAGNPGIFGYS